MQETINERIKFLISSLKMSVRAFSAVLDTPASTTRNYLDKGTKPSTDYIERISDHFKTVNLHWLITGNGEPFLTPPAEGGQTTIDAQKIFRSPVVGTNHGTSNQQQHTNSGSDADDLKTQLALMQQENEHLKTQLATKDALIASKEETIELLKAAFNRSN